MHAWFRPSGWTSWDDTLVQVRAAFGCTVAWPLRVGFDGGSDRIADGAEDAQRGSTGGEGDGGDSGDEVSITRLSAVLNRSGSELGPLLLHAVVLGDTRLFERLRRAGVPPDYRMSVPEFPDSFLVGSNVGVATPLLLAAAHGRLDIAAQLIQDSADFDFESPPVRTQRSNTTGQFVSG